MPLASSLLIHIHCRLHHTSSRRGLLFLYSSYSLFKARSAMSLPATCDLGNGESHFTQNKKAESKQQNSKSMLDVLWCIAGCTHRVPLRRLRTFPQAQHFDNLPRDLWRFLTARRARIQSPWRRPRADISSQSPLLFWYAWILCSIHSLPPQINSTITAPVYIQLYIYI